MTKSYELGDSISENEDEKITISEPITQTRVVTVRDLKRRHTRILEEIERQKVEADKIVDELININTKTELTVTEIPIKFDATIK